MCAYNRINGTYASEHRELLTDILRDEWGFDGLVVSDWAAVHDRPARRGRGPRSRDARAAATPRASGRRRGPRRARSTMPTWTGRSCGSFGSIGQAAATAKGGTFDAAAHHALARRIAADGMVLLKNDGDPAAVANRSDRGHRASRAGAAHPGRRKLADDPDERRHPARRDRARRRRSRGHVRGGLRRVRRRRPTSSPRRSNRPGPPTLRSSSSRCRCPRSPRAAIAPTWT